MLKLNRILNENPFHRILFGVFLLTVGQTLKSMLNANIYIILFGLLGWFYIIKAIYRIYGWHNPFTGLYRKMFTLYLCVVAFMFIRSFLFDFEEFQILIPTKAAWINHFFFYPMFVISYLVPLVVFIPSKYYSFKIPTIISPFMGAITVFILLFLWKKIMLQSTMMTAGFNEGAENVSNYIIYSSFSFIAFCSMYTSKKVFFWNILGVIISLLALLIGGRRGNSALFATILFFSLYYFICSVHNRSKRIIYYLLFASIICSTIIFFFNSPLFDYIHMRGFEDNRSGVDNALLSQMTDTEKWFGKGYTGKYYYPIFENDYLNGWRYSSETGFYNYVLKGGYLMIGLYIYLLLVPAIKGIFKSQNLLCKCGGIYIIISLLELYPFGWFSFNIKYFIIWMMVSICMNNKWRNYNDKEIYNKLFL